MALYSKIIFSGPPLHKMSTVRHCRVLVFNRRSSKTVLFNKRCWSRHRRFFHTKTYLQRTLLTATSWTGRFHIARYSLRGSCLECDYGTVQRQWFLHRALRSPRARYIDVRASTLSTRWLFRPRSCSLFKPKHTNRQEPIKKPIRFLAEKHGLFKFNN